MLDTKAKAPEWPQIKFTLGSHETLVSWGDGDEVTIVRQSDILAIVE